MFTQIRSTLAGRKTYLVAIGLAAIAAAEYLGYFTKEQASAIAIALTGGGLAALRAALEAKYGKPGNYR